MIETESTEREYEISIRPSNDRRCHKITQEVYFGNVNKREVSRQLSDFFTNNEI